MKAFIIMASPVFAAVIVSICGSAFASPHGSEERKYGDAAGDAVCLGSFKQNMDTGELTMIPASGGFAKSINHRL